MLIYLAEDDPIFRQIFQNTLKSDDRFVVSLFSSLEELVHSDHQANPDLIVVDVMRPDSISMENDVERIKSKYDSPYVFVTSGEAEELRERAFGLGAEGVFDKSDLNVASLRQLVLNSKARRKHTVANRNGVRTEDSVKDWTALKAPLSYLESGLSTLSEVMQETGKVGSLEFVEHLRETLQAIKQYMQDDLSQESGGSLDLLIQQSVLRIQRLAQTRQINLRVDWESTGFRQMGSGALVQLGVQHLLEGVLRCCRASDGVWMQGEKGEIPNSSIIRVHLSRRVLPSKEILFPDASAPDHIGLDALSSMQLGAMLLLLSEQQVKLSTESKQQLLSVYL